MSIGDELLGGRIHDSNATWMSRRMAEAGVGVIERRTVGDDESAVSAAIREVCVDVDLVVCCGGLGPTEDDRTRWAAAELLEEPLEEDAGALEGVQGWCRERGLPGSEARRLVARRPASATFLENSAGTAPGIRLQVQGTTVYMLPGPPAELQPMFTSAVQPHLGGGNGDARQPTEEILIAGRTEVAVADLLGDLLDRDRRPRPGIRVGQGLVRIALEDCDGDVTAAEMRSAGDRIRQRLGAAALPRGASTLAAALGQSLLDRGWTLATAESCTGGGIGAAITAEPGSSGWYLGGIQAYANAAKTSLLSVSEDLLAPDGVGAVSHEVAEAMASGARSALDASVAISVTGVAGPTGGTREKPCGTVWLGLDDGCCVQAREIRVPGSRDQVRSGTVLAAMAWVWHCARDVQAPLPWERST